MRSTLWDASSRRLRRSFCRGPSAVEGFADDYANLVSGLLDLFGATGDVSWMEWALQVQSAQDKLFWDEAAGGWSLRGLGYVFGGGASFEWRLCAVWACGWG